MGSNETAPLSVKFWVSQSVYLVEGILMMGGNGILILVILSIPKLRKRRELLILAGVALADFLYGVGTFAAGVKRSLLGVQDRSSELVTNWYCWSSFHNIFFMIGSFAGGLMLSVLSIDRFLAVRFFAVYHKLTVRYAYRVCGLIYGVVILWTLGAGVLAFLLRDEPPSVPAVCITSHVAPTWYSSIKSWGELVGGIASIVIFLLAWILFKIHKASVATTTPEAQQEIDNKRQRRMTRIVGVTVLFTFFTYFIPQIVILTTGAYAPTLASSLSPWMWSLCRVNCLVNVVIFSITIGDIRNGILSYLRFRKPNLSTA